MTTWKDDMKGGSKRSPNILPHQLAAGHPGDHSPFLDCSGAVHRSGDLGADPFIPPTVRRQIIGARGNLPVQPGWSATIV